MFTESIIYRMDALKGYYSGALCEWQLNDFDVRRLTCMGYVVYKKDCVKYPFFIAFGGCN